MIPATQETSRHALDYWQIIRNRLGLIILVFLTVFAATAVITHLMPRKYRGLTEIELKRQLEDTRVFGQLNEDRNLYSDNFLKTQIDIIRSRKTLDRVVENLKLVERWKLPAGGVQFASGRLFGNLWPDSQNKSDVISISYFDEDPQLAADIANAVVESYRQTRLEVDQERADNSIKQFTIQLAAKEQIANEARTKMLNIKRELGIIELPGESRNPMQRDIVNTIDNATLLDAARDIYKLNNEIQTLRAQISQLQTLEGDDLIRQAGELRVENETIRTVGPAYQNLLMKQQNLAGSGLGSKHPTMIGLNNEISTARKLLLDAANDYRKNLHFRITTAEKQLSEAENFNKEKREKSLEADTSNQEYLQAAQELENVERDLLKLRETLAQQQIERGIPKTAFTVHAAAEPEPFPAKPRVKVNLAIGGFAGLLLGLALAFFLEYLDTSVKSIDEIERLLGVPVLAVVPKNVGILHRVSGLNPDAEAYRILRTNIEFNRKKPHANVISVVSGGPGEGKSTTMVNLATVCAQGGYTTLLIDGDLRRPRMHTFFDVSNQVGLTTHLAMGSPLEEVIIQTPVENLYLLPSGLMPSDSSGMLNSERFHALLQDMKDRFDIVLIDSPPILGVSDASVLAAESDMTLIVAQHRKLPRQILLKVKQAVEAVGGEVVGVVLNNVDINSDSTYGYYTSYYTYYSPNGQPGKARPTVASGPARSQRGAPPQKADSYQDAF